MTRTVSESVRAESQVNDTTHDHHHTHHPSIQPTPPASHHDHDPQGRWVAATQPLFFSFWVAVCVTVRLFVCGQKNNQSISLGALASAFCRCLPSSAFLPSRSTHSSPAVSSQQSAVSSQQSSSQQSAVKSARSQGHSQIPFEKVRFGCDGQAG